MQKLALPIAALLIATSIAVADVADLHFPVVTASALDNNLDGIGDVLTDPSTLVQLDPGGEHRALLEFDITQTLLPNYTDIKIMVRIDALDTLNLGPRQFNFFLYDGDGVASLADFQVPGVLIGTEQFDPSVDPYLFAEITVTSVVSAMRLAGITHAGLRVQASSNPSGANEVNAGWTALLFEDCPVQNSFCFGDGTGTPCPCGNFGSAGSGCANSAFSGAVLNSQGSTSISTPPQFQLVVTDAAPNKPGLFLEGSASLTPGIAIGDGLLCISQNTHRLDLGFTSPSGTLTSTIDIAAATNVLAGDTRYYQFWYRDPTGPCNGPDFNFSNGLSVTWLP